ncbi:MAG TPA: phosphoribosyltransferase family protein [Candidatus Paceibacterota bacterium]
MPSFIHRALDYLIDLILPRRCLGCGASGFDLCDRCLERFPAAEELGGGNGALYAYQTPAVKAAIWQLKYRGAKKIGGRFGQELHRRFGQRFSALENKRWLVLPIPVSAARRRERGFNQAAVIAQAFAAPAPAKFFFNDRLLVKIKETPTQVSIKNRTARLANLKNAFAVRAPEQIVGQKIILIDDVFTTGGTIAEAKRILRRAGAATVTALTIAHG